MLPPISPACRRRLILFRLRSVVESKHQSSIVVTATSSFSFSSSSVHVVTFGLVVVVGCRLSSNLRVKSCLVLNYSNFPPLRRRYGVVCRDSWRCHIHYGDPDAPPRPVHCSRGYGGGHGALLDRHVPTD